MTTEAAVNLSSITRPAQRAEHRLRLRRAILWAAKALAGGLVAIAVLLVLRKVGLVSERFCRVGVALAMLQVFVAAGIAYARQLPRRAGAVALDRFHGLADRLSSALSFGDLRADERTPFMLAAIDDALVYAGKVDPAKAVPMQRPREWPFVLAMVGACVVIGMFEVRKHQPVMTAKTIDAVDVTQDDLDAMREFLKDIDQKLQSDEAKAATQEFNQLIEDLANKRLDRTEAFRRMQQLEDKLLEGNEADKKALEDAMKQMGEDLKKSELSKPTGEALSDQKLADAQKSLKDLAKELRDAKENGKSGQSKEALDKLREALKKASEEQSKRSEALEKRREELKEDLLKKKQNSPDGGAQSEEEKSLLQKKERELERLDREKEQQSSTQRQLDRLDRELQKAAEDLAKDLGLSADDLEQAAEDINRMEKQEMTQEEKEQLRDKLQELREMMRQQAQGGQGQMQRLRVFQKKAQGGGQGQAGKGQPGQGQPQQGQGQEGQGEGQQGQGQQGQGQKDGQGGQQGGQQGQGGSQGQGQGGQGNGGGQGETWVLGPNGEKLLMLSKGQGQGGGQGSGNGNGGGGSKGQGQGYGTGHDEHVQGAATNPKMGTQDSQIQGNDTGQGGSRSEVILGAAERGFSSRGYTKVYREYHTVAEEALNKDEIPGGYRFYVRRYFQLIRPRDDAGGTSTGGAPAPGAPAPQTPPNP